MRLFVVLHVAVAARERRLRRRRRLALRRGRKGPQGVRLHRLGARQGREAVLAARRRGRRPGVGSLQADVRQVLGAVPAQVLPTRNQYSPPPESPHRITTRVAIQTHVRGGGLPKHKFTKLTRRRRRGGPACRAAVQARDGKKSEPAPTMYARFPVLSPRHLTRGDTLLYSRRGRYRRLSRKDAARRYGATFVCGCSGPG